MLLLLLLLDFAYEDLDGLLFGFCKTCNIICRRCGVAFRLTSMKFFLPIIIIFCNKGCQTDTFKLVIIIKFTMVSSDQRLLGHTVILGQPKNSLPM